MGIGILSKHEVLTELHEPSGGGPRRISRPSQEPLAELVDRSAIDLPLGTDYWVMQGSCRAGVGMMVESDLIPRFSADPLPRHLDGDLVLDKDSVYLFKADCRLNLQDTVIQGKATAKSSIGRLDVLVRLLCNRATEFDRIPAHYTGDLYVEITPITFNIVVRPGTCLSQLRLFRGVDRLVSMQKEEFDYEQIFPVVTDQKRFATNDPHEVAYPFGLNLQPDPRTGVSGFVARQDVANPIDPTLENHYTPDRFWEAAPLIRGEPNAIKLQRDRLYILRSVEHLRMPGHIALECKAYTETMGEWRIEYAGFAHPFFGWSRETGSPLMFEVRGHNIPTILTHGIPLGNVSFKRMSRYEPEPEDESDYGHYEQQELKLSKCFKDWPAQNERT